MQVMHLVALGSSFTGKCIYLPLVSLVAFLGLPCGVFSTGFQIGCAPVGESFKLKLCNWVLGGFPNMVQISLFLASTLEG